MASNTPHTARLQITQEQMSERRKATIDIICDEIKARMKLRAQPSISFIVISDIREIWQERGRLSAVLWPWKPKEEELQYIQKHMILMLSCLIYIDSTEWLPHLWDRLWDSDQGVPLIEDEDLPVPEDSDKLLFLETSAARTQFFEKQYIFKPLIIKVFREDKPQIESRENRLPFEEWEEEVGYGGFGSIDKVKIPAGYFRDAKNKTYEQVGPIEMIWDMND